MKVTLDGWPIDLDEVYIEALPDRAKHTLGHQLFTSPDGQWAVLLYAIGEVGMMKQVGRAVLLHDRDRPTIVSRLDGRVFWYEGVADVPVRFDANGGEAHLDEYFVEGLLADGRNPRRMGVRPFAVVLRLEGGGR
jgi:hypothetical protein